MGLTSLIKHHIDYEGEAIKEKPRIWPPKLAAEIKRQTDALLAQGKFERSISPFGFNIALDRKSDNSWRLAINFKKLNRKTKLTSAPIHNAKHILRLLRGGGYYAKVDLKSGFWQIPLDEKSRPMTAFYANGCLYQWRVLPFGLSGAPATFVQLMNITLDGYIGTFVFVYFDDIILRSDSFQDHLTHIRIVMERLKWAGLSINLKKSHFGRRQIDFLGYIIGPEGLKKNPDKIRPIIEYPRPSSKEHIEIFMGLCAYYSDFIKNFAMVGEPLYRLTGDYVKFEWKQEQEDAFNNLKDVICSDVVLDGIDYKHKLLLKCDASDVGVGFVLEIDYGDKVRPAFFGSKTLSPAERKLNTTKKEGLAMTFALTKCADLLWGEEFTVFTDHKALTYLRDSNNEKDRRVNTLSNLLEEFQCEVKHIKGSENKVSDALSRAPIPAVDETDHLSNCRDIMYFPIVCTTFAETLFEKILK